MITLSKFVSYRLPRWNNDDAQKYWEFCKQGVRQGYEWHHLLKRQHGHLLVVHIPAVDHKRIHSKGYNDGEYEDLFVQAIDNLLCYIRYLQQTNLIKQEKINDLQNV